MTHQRNPVCFVAMAFGRDDTDRFYDELILPVLRKCNIRSVIINRLQTNDDLNIEIIEQLDNADLCIADLTYARPSVYYEAGYAQKRDIPVIYTVRKDHLNLGQPDDKRVHFDLLMKSIIDWKNPSDDTFANRLERRIRYTFLNNWNQKQEVNLKHYDAESEFQKLPMLVRMQRIRQDTVKLLKNTGFSYWSVYDYFNRLSNISSSPHKQSIYSGVYNHLIGHKIEKAKMHVASVHTFTSPSKKELLYIGEDHILAFTYDLIIKKNIRQFVATYFVISLENVTTGRIENTLHSIVPTDDGVYYQDFGRQTRWADGRKRVIFLGVNYVFLSGIKSELQLNERLGPAIKNLLSKPQSM